MLAERLGWSPFFEKALAALGDGGLLAARVSRAHREQYAVLVPGMDGELLAELGGRLRHDALRASDLPVVGDWVAVQPLADEPRCVVRHLLPRRGAFSRKVAGETMAEQVLAANLDTLFLVMGLDRDYNLRRLERYLTLAAGSGARPVVVLNKADACQDAAQRRDEVQALAPDAPVCAVSALAGEGLESLHPFLGTGQTVGLLGSSGVGKSTLINALAGTQRQRVAPVRAGDGRGRHTTTHRELIALPSGALVIDTPGLRELQLWGDEEALASSFEEIEQLAGGCRFRDCSHEGEPGCAVQAAVERGELTAERLESYHRQRRELRHLELRNTHHQREQERRFDKHVQKSLRRHFRHKGRF